MKQFGCKEGLLHTRSDAERLGAILLEPGPVTRTSIVICARSRMLSCRARIVTITRVVISTPVAVRTN